MSSLPTQFDGAGTLSMTLADSQATVGQDIALLPVTPVQVAGNVAVAPGYSVLSRTLRASFPPSNSLVLASDYSFGGGTVSPAYGYLGFSAAALALRLTTSAQNEANAFVEAWRTGSSLPNGATLNLPAAPLVQAAAPSASAVTHGSTLAWTKLDGAVYDVLLSPTIIGAGPTLRVVTSGTSVEIPDLSSMGLAWPKSVAYRMDMNAYAPHTVDDAATNSDLSASDTDGVYAASAPGAFTTAP